MCALRRRIVYITLTKAPKRSTKELQILKLRRFSSFVNKNAKITHSALFQKVGVMNIVGGGSFWEVLTKGNKQITWGKSIWENFRHLDKTSRKFAQ